MTIFWLWISIGLLLVHTYLLFPVCLRALRQSRGRFRWVRPQIHENLPFVSLVMSAYNEEDVLEEKIANCLALNYPRDRLEILVGSDGSKDRTAEILAKYSHQIRAQIFTVNRGKAAVLNDLAAMAQGEILVLCDTNTMLVPDALQHLVTPFAHKHVGCVNGRLILIDSGKTILGEGESLYWRIETEIKNLEGDLDLLLGLNGALYAIRKELYPGLPTHKKLMDDFYVCASILKQGYASVASNQAIGLEHTSSEESGEFRRKIRIGQANFNYLRSYLPLLHPRNPLLAFIFFSHKLLRWFSPHLLLGFFVTTGVLCVSWPILFGPLLAVQCLFYIFALLGYWQPQSGLPVVRIAYYFCSMNAALFLGFFRSLGTKDSGGGWERVARETKSS